MMNHAPTNLGRSRRAVAALVAVALVVGLTGCFPSRGVSGGQTAAAAMSEVKSIPGIADPTYVASDSSYSGLTKLTSTTVHVSIDSEDHIPDPEALVDFLIRMAWSVNDAKPNQAVMTVAIDSADPLDVAAAAQKAGWKSAFSYPELPTTIFVKLSEAKKRLGAWPGKVPTVPDGVIVTSTASPAP